LFKRVKDEIPFNHNGTANNIIGRLAGSLVNVVAELRNNFGAASHGDDGYHENPIDSPSADFVMSSVDGLAALLYSKHKNTIVPERATRINYQDFPEFNDWMDEQGKDFEIVVGEEIVFRYTASRILFDQDMNAYKELLIQYLDGETPTLYSKNSEDTLDEVDQSVSEVKELLQSFSVLMQEFESGLYFKGDHDSQLDCLNLSAEFVLHNYELKRKFITLVGLMNQAYDECFESEKLSKQEHDNIHYYLSVFIIFTALTKGEVPTIISMNKKAREVAIEALQKNGVNEILELVQNEDNETLFDNSFLEKVSAINLPHTKSMLLDRLLAQQLVEFSEVNKAKADEFSNSYQALVDKYKEPSEEGVEGFISELISLQQRISTAMIELKGMDISIEEKAFYDVLQSLIAKYDYQYPESSLLELAKFVNDVLEDKAKYTDWNNRDDIKAELKVDLILLFAKHEFPPIDRNEIYNNIFEQALSYRKFRTDKAK
jgi:hypothetical protein